jgi:hypothetical protein
VFIRGFNSPTATGDMPGKSSRLAAVVPSTLGRGIRHPAVQPIARAGEARTVAFAITLPEDRINEILFRPTRRES